MEDVRELKAIKLANMFILDSHKEFSHSHDLVFYNHTHFFFLQCKLKSSMVKYLSNAINKSKVTRFHHPTCG